MVLVYGNVFKKEALKHWNLQGGVYLNNGQLGGMRDAKKT